MVAALQDGGQLIAYSNESMGKQAGLVLILIIFTVNGYGIVPVNVTLQQPSTGRDIINVTLIFTQMASWDIEIMVLA